MPFAGPQTLGLGGIIDFGPVSLGAAPVVVGGAPSGRIGAFMFGGFGRARIIDFGPAPSDAAVAAPVVVGGAPSGRIGAFMFGGFGRARIIDFGPAPSDATMAGASITLGVSDVSTTFRVTPEHIPMRIQPAPRPMKVTTGAKDRFVRGNFTPAR